jgi:hypothetical protein
MRGETIKKKLLLLSAFALMLVYPIMTLGSIFRLAAGTFQYIEWILYWPGNVALVVSVVASFGAGARIGRLIYSYIKKKGIKWTVK